MSSSLVEYLLIGKIAIFFLQNFPFSKLPIIGSIFRRETIVHLFGCDLCLGAWVYMALAIMYRINVLCDIITIPILSEIFTGLLASFVMHIFTLGWKTKFTNIILE